MSSNGRLHHLAIRVHFSCNVESHPLQQSTLVLPCSFDGFLHLEGVFRLGFTIFKAKVPLGWWELAKINACVGHRKLTKEVPLGCRLREPLVPKDVRSDR